MLHLPPWVVLIVGVLCVVGCECLVASSSLHACAITLTFAAVRHWPTAERHGSQSSSGGAAAAAHRPARSVHAFTRFHHGRHGTLLSRALISGVWSWLNLVLLHVGLNPASLGTRAWLSCSFLFFGFSLATVRRRGAKRASAFGHVSWSVEGVTVASLGYLALLLARSAPQLTGAVAGAVVLPFVAVGERVLASTDGAIADREEDEVLTFYLGTQSIISLACALIMLLLSYLLGPFAASVMGDSVFFSAVFSSSAGQAPSFGMLLLGSLPRGILGYLIVLHARFGTIDGHQQERAQQQLGAACLPCRRANPLPLTLTVASLIAAPLMRVALLSAAGPAAASEGASLPGDDESSSGDGTVGVAAAAAAWALSPVWVDLLAVLPAVCFALAAHRLRVLPFAGLIPPGRYDDDDENRLMQGPPVDDTTAAHHLHGVDGDGWGNRSSSGGLSGIFRTIFLDEPDGAAAAMFLDAEYARATADGEHATSGGIDDTAMGKAEWLERRTRHRRLKIFLFMNLSYMAVEFIVGVSSNSLGLISDSFHMMLDSASVAIGLYAATMARAPPTARHPLGQSRVEPVSGFVNGVLLAFLSLGIFTEGISRLVDPPDVRSELLLPVSFAGLGINIIGAVFFHDAHGHSHAHGCSGGHGHSHGSGDEQEQNNKAGFLTRLLALDGLDPNLRGVYYHVLADLFGSIGVIFSTLVMRYTGFTRADALCSLAVASLVFVAAKALIQDTTGVLLLRWPIDGTPAAEASTRILQEMGGDVVAVGSLLSWVNSPTAGNLATCCSCAVTVRSTADIATVRARLTSLLLELNLASSVDALTIEAATEDG